MHWLKLPLAVIRSAEVVGAEPRAVALWLQAIAWSAEQESSGIVPDQSSGLWSRLGLPGDLDAAIAAGLIRDDHGKLGVFGYDLATESALVRQRQAGSAGALFGRRGGRPRNPLGVTANNPLGVTNGNPLRKPQIRRDQRREEEKREERSDPVLIAPGGAEVVTDFDRFWDAYPRRTAKAAARKAWNAEKPPLPAVIDALSWQCSQDQWLRDGGRFVPHPATWIRAHRWLDERPTLPHMDDSTIAGLRWLAKGTP